MNRNIEGEFEFEDTQTVIVVSVGEKNGNRDKLILDNSGRDEIRLVSWVNDECFPGFVVSNEITVGF